MTHASGDESMTPQLPRCFAFPQVYDAQLRAYLDIESLVKWFTSKGM
jgi:hypothetical protein